MGAIFLSPVRYEKDQKVFYYKNPQQNSDGEQQDFWISHPGNDGATVVVK